MMPTRLRWTNGERQPITGAASAAARRRLTGVAVSSRCVETGRCALHHAAANGHAAAVQLLLGTESEDHRGKKLNGDRGGGGGEGKKHGGRSRAAGCWLSGFEHCASPRALDVSGLSASMAARAGGHAKLADDIDAFVAAAEDSSSLPTRLRRHVPILGIAQGDRNDEHANSSDDWAEDDDYAYAWPSDED